MTFLFRRHREERRSITSVPWDQGGVYPNDAATALSLAPVFASVRLLSDSLSTLPVKGFRKDGEERLTMSTPPALIANLERAGRLCPWVAQAVSSLALQGNAIGLLSNIDGYGFPTTVTWVDVHRDIFVDDSMYPNVVWYYKGRVVNPADFLHIPWVTIPGRTLGLSPVECYALTIGAGLKAQSYGSQWFDNGGVPPGTFRNEAATITADEADTISERLVKAIRKGRPLTYGKDWQYDAISIPPEQAQFIQSQKLTATQIAAIYGIDPTWIGGESGNSLTYANVEQRAIEFTTFGLRPWAVRMEAGLFSILPERQYVKFMLDALVRADLKTRHEVYKIDRDIGLRNIDEERALEDLPPLPGGKGQDYTPGASKALAPPTVPPPEGMPADMPPPPEGNSAARLSLLKGETQ